MKLSVFVCPLGHITWSPTRIDHCYHGRCRQPRPVECVAGPLKRKVVAAE